MKQSLLLLLALNPVGSWVGSLPDLANLSNSVKVSISTPRKQTFDEALRAAENNEMTPEGVAYEAPLARFSSKHFAVLIGDCMEEFEAPDTASFRVLLKVRENGAIAEGLVKPETNLGVCFRNKLKRRRLPKPPRPGYWVLVDVRLLK